MALPVSQAYLWLEWRSLLGERSQLNYISEMEKCKFPQRQPTATTTTIDRCNMV